MISSKIEKLSIGIVCYDEGQKIYNLLKSLIYKDNLDWIHEVIIVDNSSDSKMHRVIRNFPELHVIEPDRLLFFCNPSNNLGLARKLIVEKASCDWLAFTDGDCVIPKNWLRDLIDLAESQISPCLAAVGGGQDWPEEVTVLNAGKPSLFLTGGSPQTVKYNKIQSVDHIPTTNGLFYRPHVLRIGNFSDKLNRGGEDLNLGLRLKNAGFQMYMGSQPCVLNNCSQSLMGWLLRAFRLGTCQMKAGAIQYLRFIALLPLMSVVFVALCYWAHPLIPAVGLLIYVVVGVILSLNIVGWHFLRAVSLFVLWMATHTFYGMGVIYGVLSSVLLFPGRLVGTSLLTCVGGLGKNDATT